MQTFERIISHRGASAYAPENTLAAFKKAFELGSKFVEFDVMLSRDAEPFVFHDATLERTSNGRGKVGKVSAKYMRELDAGLWFGAAYGGEKIPHFTEVLDFLIAYQVNANIEIKPTAVNVSQTVTIIIDYIHRYSQHTLPLFLLSSFDFSAIKSCLMLAPEIPRGLILRDWDKEWLQKVRQLHCYSLHINYRALNFARVNEIKAEGYKVFAYTVNKKQIANNLFALGVDAVFSNYPDLLSL